MRIEDYFNFLVEDDIRIQGTHIGIETVLDEYIHEGKTAEAIADRFVTVRLHWNRFTLQFYIICKTEKKLVRIWKVIWNTIGRHEQNPPSGVVRLRELKAVWQNAAGEAKVGKHLDIPVDLWHNC